MPTVQFVRWGVHALSQFYCLKKKQMMTELLNYLKK